MGRKKKGTTAARPRAARAPRAVKPPRAKHVTILPGQRLHVHVAKGTKAVSEYIAGANAEGVVTMNLAPEADAPVAVPSPVSGT